jgi:hypothetical protein
MHVTVDAPDSLIDLHNFQRHYTTFGQLQVHVDCKVDYRLHSLNIGDVLAQLLLQFFAPPFNQVLVLGNKLSFGLQFFLHCSNLLGSANPNMSTRLSIIRLVITVT